MSQAYGRMYHPHPHHHHNVHNQGPPFRQAGEAVPQHHHPGYSNHRGYHQNHYSPPQQQQQQQQQRPAPSHSSYSNSVSVYSVPKPSRPYNSYNNRRGRGGGTAGGGSSSSQGRGGYHNHNNHSNHHANNHHHHHHANNSSHQGYAGHTHNNYRPHPPDFDLEWDNYDFNAEGPSGKRAGRPRNSNPNHGGGPALNDSELEWDDYDLRPKEEVEEDQPDTLDYILTEGVFPLIGVVTKAPLSRGHIPLGAIQVCRFPQGGAGFRALASSDHFSKSLRLNKDLLVLTSELNEGGLFSSGLDSPNETKDYLLADLALTRDKDSRASPTDSPGKDGESEGASNGISEEDLDEDLLNAVYESGYQDRLGDIDLYALAPHDFDSPDSTFSRSLADLTDISLYNMDASMASKVNKQAAKRKHPPGGLAPANPQLGCPSESAVAAGKAEEATPSTKHVWGESPIDEDGCSITLDPVTGSATFHSKIRRCAGSPNTTTTPDQQADGSPAIKSMLLDSEQQAVSSVDDTDLTLMALGNFDIFEPDSVPTWSLQGSAQSGESDTSTCNDLEHLQHAANNSLTNQDEELGIDPNLLRLGLERSRSLGDATRGQDVTKDRILKGVKAKKRKRKGSDKLEDSPLAGIGEEGSDRKTKRLAPNFFVAIQVSNPLIHDTLKDVQQTVVAGDEKLKDAMVPIATLHLTIMVMHLATDEDVERAKVALNECHRLLSPKFQKEKLSILFGGLGHFNNQVMFAKIKDQDSILESLYEIADTVEKCFSDYQLVSTGERGFKPHLTVMKLSRAPSLRKKGVRRIKSELYKAHSTQVFGMQVVEGLQLCSINKPKTPDGYYCKAAEVMFGEPTCCLDRNIHTISEGEEPSKETLSHENGTENPPATRQTEEPMDVIKEASTSDENNSKPREPSHPVCDTAMDCEGSKSCDVAGPNHSCCKTDDTTPSKASDVTQNTATDTTCTTTNGTAQNTIDRSGDTPGDRTQDTPSDRLEDTLGNRNQDLISSDKMQDTPPGTIQGMPADTPGDTPIDKTMDPLSSLPGSTPSNEESNQIKCEEDERKRTTDSKQLTESVQSHPTASDNGPS